MKRYVFLMILSVFSILLCSCGKNNDEFIDVVPEISGNEYVKIEYYNTKGTITKEEYLGYNPYSVDYYYDETNHLLNAKLSKSDAGRTLYKYNLYYNNGLLNNKITYDSNGVIQENITYTYKNGYLSKEDITSYSTLKGKTVEVKYYENNQLKKIVGEDWYYEYSDNIEYRYKLVDDEYILTDEINYQYNDRGDILKEIHLNCVIVYYYDSSNKLEKVYTYEPDDSNDENITIGILNEYDDRGNLIHKQTYRYFGEKTDLEYDVYIEYDDNNNPIKQITNDKIDFSKEFDYYDNGKIKEIRYFVTGD